MSFWLMMRFKKYLKVGQKNPTTQQSNNPSWRKLIPTINKKPSHKTWLNTLLGEELPWEPGLVSQHLRKLEVILERRNAGAIKLPCVYNTLFWSVSQKSDFRVLFLKILSQWAGPEMRPSNLNYFRKQFATILRATLWEMLILWCPSEWLKILKLDT